MCAGRCAASAAISGHAGSSDTSSRYGRTACRDYPLRGPLVRVRSGHEHLRQRSGHEDLRQRSRTHRTHA
jgi:hypothetical protein